MNRANFFRGDAARRAARALVRLYYSPLEVSGREELPSGGPILFVANHPNSLLDPVMIGLATGARVHFLAKAPLFETPVLGSLMTALGMVPAFRGSDDRAQVGRNVESLTVAAKLLAEGGAVGIFPEGKSHDAFKVDQVRSGAGRIAMQALELGANEVWVVPLGINYEAKERFRSGVWISIGERISARAVLEEAGGDSHAAMRTLTREIDRGLKSVAVHVTEPKWEPLLQDIECVLAPTAAEVEKGVSAVRRRKRIADAMNYYREQGGDRAAQVAEGLVALHREVAAVGLDLRAPCLRWRGWRAGWALAWESLWILFWSIPALLGAVFHLVPFVLVRLLARMVSPAGKMTLALYRLGFGVPIYGGWYALGGWWAIGYFRPWVAYAWLAAMPFVGIFALEYFRRARRFVGLWLNEARLSWRRSALAKLRERYGSVAASVSELAEAYRRERGAASGVAAVRLQGPPVRGAMWWLLVLVLAFSIFAMGWRSWQNPLAVWAGRGLALERYSEAVLGSMIASDRVALGEVLRGLETLEERTMALQAEFREGKRTYFNQADVEQVQQLYLTYLNYRTALLRLIWKYQGYEVVADPEDRLRCFLVGYTAAAGLYQSSWKLVLDFGASPEAARKLNEPEPVLGIRPGTFDEIRRNLVHPSVRGWLRHAAASYEKERPNFEKHGLGAATEWAAFHSAIGRLTESHLEPSVVLARETLASTFNEAGREPKQWMYEAQTAVSTWIGDARIREPRDGRALIQPDQVQELRRKLKPGDILIERRNWYLSNAFLPGFWPHSALYVGTAEELRELGVDRDPRVQAHWKEFQQRDGEGHERVVIESVSEGVVFTSLEHSVGEADSAAALRPRLSLEQRRECIARAFSHAGKPYDFEFDFFSGDKLVCTELVFRAYDGALQLPLVTVMGRKTMPALEFVRKYCDECRRPDGQLEFVAFLDGDESSGRARFAGEGEFMETLNRPALTWLQTAAPTASGTRR